MRQNGGHLAAVLHTQKPRPYNAQFSEHHDQQHFELLLTVNGMRVTSGHDDGLALVQHIRSAVNGDTANAVQTGNERVAAGFMGADLLALVKGKQRDAQRVALRERSAHDLTGLIGDLLLDCENSGLFYIFDTRHMNSSDFDQDSLMIPCSPEKICYNNGTHASEVCKAHCKGVPPCTWIYPRASLSVSAVLTGEGTRTEESEETT